MASPRGACRPGCDMKVSLSCDVHVSWLWPMWTYVCGQYVCGQYVCVSMYGPGAATLCGKRNRLALKMLSAAVCAHEYATRVLAVRSADAQWKCQSPPTSCHSWPVCMWPVCMCEYVCTRRGYTRGKQTIALKR